MALWSDEDVKARALEEEARKARRGAGLARALALVAGLLVLVLVAGSVYGLVSGTRLQKLRSETEGTQLRVELTGRTAFTGIGTVRAKSADRKAPAIVVATIAFPYDSGDRPFAEELGRKSAVLRAAALVVLSSKKAADLGPAFEGALKAALRDAFNARLSLGKVAEIWLSDFALIQ